MPASPRSAESGPDDVKVEGEERTNVEELAAEMKEDGEGDSAVSGPRLRLLLFKTRRVVMLKGSLSVSFATGLLDTVNSPEAF